MLVFIAGPALLWYLGHLDKVLPGQKSASLMGTYAPAYKASRVVRDANAPATRTHH